jgi:hypothetical protein
MANKKLSKASNIDIKKRLMIDALTKSLGIVTSAAKSVGICRDSHYDWYKSDKNYAKQVDSIVDVALDFAESQLHKQIQNGEVASTIFYLKQKGGKRGYSEKDQTPNVTIRVINDE